MSFNLNSATPANALSTWVNLMERQSPDNKKSFVCRDAKAKDSYYASSDPKDKLNVLEIIDVLENLTKLENDSQSLRSCQAFLGKFKKKLRSKYYAGLTGRILKIVAYIFLRYSFENSIVGKRIYSLENTLHDQSEKQFKIKVWKKYFTDRRGEIMEALKGAKIGNVLNHLKAHFEAFCARKHVSLDEQIKKLQSLNLNDELKLVWYWDEIEGLYLDEKNLPILEEIFSLLPDAFHARHTDLMNEMGYNQQKEDYVKIVEDTQRILREMQQQTQSHLATYSISSTTVSPNCNLKKELLSYAVKRNINFNRDQEKELVAFYEKLKALNPFYEPVYAEFLENKGNRMASLAAYLFNIQKLHTPDCKIETPQFLQQYL